MADAIYSIVKYPAMYNTLHKEGQFEVNNITWENAGQKVRDIYNKVLGWH
jgi:glycosyltransferase involved in cell wall biosynthesis